MAVPTYIPVKSDRKQHSGLLGIMDNVMARTTEVPVLFPPRQGRQRSYTFQPPTYTTRDGATHSMVWCPGCSEWQRREAFYTNVTRITGLQAHCKTCDNDKRVARRRRQLERLS